VLVVVVEGLQDQVPVGWGRALIIADPAPAQLAPAETHDAVGETVAHWVWQFVSL
jgi:hypothetical protein